MTKEELKQEARQKALEWNGEKINGKYNRPPIANWSCYEKGYLAGAEPREKRIAELEESNKELQRTCEAKSDTNSQLVEQLADKVEKIATLERNVTYYAERAKQAELQGRDVALKNKELEEKLANADYQLEGRDLEIKELKEQIEKLIDFVLSKTECCDVCPITDTCINSEGTCPYAGILSKGEEAVTREWLMQKIAKEIKENDNTRIIK